MSSFRTQKNVYIASMKEWKKSHWGCIWSKEIWCTCCLVNICLLIRSDIISLLFTTNSVLIGEIDDALGSHLFILIYDFMVDWRAYNRPSCRSRIHSSRTYSTNSLLKSRGVLGTDGQNPQTSSTRLPLPSLTLRPQSCYSWSMLMLDEVMWEQQK